VSPLEMSKSRHPMNQSIPLVYSLTPAFQPQRKGAAMSPRATPTHRPCTDCRARGVVQTSHARTNSAGHPMTLVRVCTTCHGQGVVTQAPRIGQRDLLEK
jgi:DnaJ-class molecular chaperone